MTSNPKFAELRKPVEMEQAAESIILQGPKPVGTVIQGQAPASARFKMDARYVEVKSQRMQLLLQPSKVNAIRKYAHDHSISNNEVVNQALIKFLGLDE